MKLNLSKRIALITASLILVVVIVLGFLAINFSSTAMVNLSKEALTNAAGEGVDIIEANVSKDINILSHLL